MNDEIIHAAPETAPDGLGDAPAATPTDGLPPPPSEPTLLSAPGFEPAADPRDYRLPGHDDPLDRASIDADEYVRDALYAFRMPADLGSSLAQMVTDLTDPSTETLSDAEFQLAWSTTREHLTRLWGVDTFKARHAALVALVEDVDRRTGGAATDLLDALPGVLLDEMCFAQISMHAERWLASQPKASR
jgi:hypothetical protein